MSHEYSTGIYAFSTFNLKKWYKNEKASTCMCILKILLAIEYLYLWVSTQTQPYLNQQASIVYVPEWDHEIISNDISLQLSFPFQMSLQEKADDKGLMRGQSLGKLMSDLRNVGKKIKDILMDTDMSGLTPAQVRFHCPCMHN